MFTTHLIAIAALLAAADFEAKNLAGRAVVGRVVALDAQNLELESDTGRVRLPLPTLATVNRVGAGAADASKAAALLELIDQTTLAIAGYTAADATAHIRLVSGTEIEIPTRAIRSVRLAAPSGADAKLNQQWSEIVDTKASGDLLIVRKNGALDYLEGVQGEVTADACKFQLDGEWLPVKRAKVEGIVYFHARPAELAEPLGFLSTTDGSRLAVRGVTLAAEGLAVVTPAEVNLQVPIEAVERLDFSSGKIAYLSDLQPESAVYVPFWGLAQEPVAVREYYQFRRDSGFDQQPLRLAGKTYRKGLALQSRTTLVYKLPGKFRLFKATIGIDDSARDTGNVHVEIRSDGNRLWQGEVSNSDPPRELELELGGAKRLEILVDYGAEMDIGDRLDLCEACVTK